MLELPAYLAIGAASGMLAGLFGVGGGVIVVPALILLFGQIGMVEDWIPHLAVGTSLAAIVGTGAASTYAHHGRGAVRWDLSPDWHPASSSAPGSVQPWRGSSPSSG